MRRVERKREGRIAAERREEGGEESRRGGCGMCGGKGSGAVLAVERGWRRGVGEGGLW